MTHPLSPLTKAMQSQLAVMEHFLNDMLINVHQAQESLDQNNRNAAIGALHQSKEAFTSIQALFDTLTLMHRNSALIERDAQHNPTGDHA